LLYISFIEKQNRAESHFPTLSIFCALQIFHSACHSNVCRHGGNCQRKSADCEIQPAAEAVDCETEITSWMQSACKLQPARLLFSLYISNGNCIARALRFLSLHSSPPFRMCTYLVICAGVCVWQMAVRRIGDISRPLVFKFVAR
jgi:hypothetical protein